MREIANKKSQPLRLRMRLWLIWNLCRFLWSPSDQRTNIERNDFFPCLSAMRRGTAVTKYNGNHPPAVMPKRIRSSMLMEISCSTMWFILQWRISTSRLAIAQRRMRSRRIFMVLASIPCFLHHWDCHPVDLSMEWIFASGDLLNGKTTILMHK